MEKRNKGWRAQQRKLHYVRRIKFFSNSSFRFVICPFITADGQTTEHPTWKDLEQKAWNYVYRTTGKPCSCWMCSPNKYKRKNHKKETRMLLKLEFESEL